LRLPKVPPQNYAVKKKKPRREVNFVLNFTSSLIAKAREFVASFPGRGRGEGAIFSFQIFGFWSDSRAPGKAKKKKKKKTFSGGATDGGPIWGRPTDFFKNVLRGFVGEVFSLLKPTWGGRGFPRGGKNTRGDGFDPRPGRPHARGNIFIWGGRFGGFWLFHGSNPPSCGGRANKLGLDRRAGAAGPMAPPTPAPEGPTPANKGVREKGPKKKTGHKVHLRGNLQPRARGDGPEGFVGLTGRIFLSKRKPHGCRKKFVLAGLETGEPKGQKKPKGRGGRAKILFSEKAGAFFFSRRGLDSGHKGGKKVRIFAFYLTAGRAVFECCGVGKKKKKQRRPGRIRSFFGFPGGQCGGAMGAGHKKLRMGWSGFFGFFYFCLPLPGAFVNVGGRGEKKNFRFKRPEGVSCWDGWNPHVFFVIWVGGGRELGHEFFQTAVVKSNSPVGMAGAEKKLRGANPGLDGRGQIRGRTLLGPGGGSRGNPR